MTDASSKSSAVLGTPAPSPPWILRFLEDVAVGGTIAAVVKTMLAPVERVKLLRQMTASHPDVLSGKAADYRSTVDCFRRVWREQGVRSFWRGNLVNCLRYAPQQATALACNDTLNNLFPQYDSKTQFWKSFGTKLLSGGLAGAIGITVCYPFDFARTRLASDIGGGKPLFNGIVDCMGTTLRKQGVSGLYTGWGVAVAGVFVYRAGQLGLFRQIQELNPYRHDRGSLGAISSFAAVTMARCAITPFSYPFDTVRRRMMQWAERPVAERLYRNARHCFLEVVRREGVRGLYRGAVPEVFRGFAGSCVVVAYDRLPRVRGAAV